MEAVGSGGYRTRPGGREDDVDGYGGKYGGRVGYGVSEGRRVIGIKTVK